jgi:predicted Zn-dependent protease
MFVPFAVLAREQLYAFDEDEDRRPAWQRLLTGSAGMILASVLIGVLLIALLPPVRSQLQANLGALAQTRAELSVYEWPEWSLQDELRRARGLNLDPALARYRHALRLDGSNATANRRLGQIALSTGDYEDAGLRLAAAYQASPANRAARQLFGEWLAMSGRTHEAAALWRTLDMGQGQLAARIWWYEYLGESDRAAALAMAGRMR